MRKIKIYTKDSETYVTTTKDSFSIYCARSNSLGGCMVTNEFTNFYIPMGLITKIEDLGTSDSGLNNFTKS